MVNDYLDKLCNPDDDPEELEWFKIDMFNIEDDILCPSCAEKYDSYDDLAACCTLAGVTRDNDEIFICRKCGNRLIIYDKSVEFNEESE